MSKLKKGRGIEELKARYGLMFILPWIIGLIMFFFYPLVQSIIYSFSDVVVSPGNVDTTWVGLKHYNEILNVDKDYTTQLTAALTSILYSLPIILVLSLILAMMLNQKFRGRIFFRSLYFLPVIIATGQVIKIVFSMSDDSLSEMGVSGGMAAGMISVEDITGMLDIGDDIAKFITTTINDIFNLIWSCGIQIVLYLSGLQSIPATLYEASRVEGATKWEEFWFITFPMLSRITLLVGVFTMVELFIDEKLALIERVYGSMLASEYDKPSAMIWLYFGIICVVMGLIILLYNRLIMKRYEA